ncbi:MAG: PQQ-dependent sugar dehydrogenase [Gammaproteobacteria bacterium]|nr:PQQ-dependent sugar dehydrogenase [Gammaproteobacteria bacterium]MCY4165896.1 PQQ-dependent sugar dehydrogenase [Gammaproteobacteria bacterium]MCY4340003.1 PQQ-dependent sugar dehydrogenase [Gammaproteobacteria bacterium]
MIRSLICALLAAACAANSFAGAQPEGVPPVVDLRKLNMPDAPPDLVARLYQRECAVCHGEALQGAPQGTALKGAGLLHGNSSDDIAKSIAEGFSDRGMPGFSPTLSETQIRSLALYILEQRQGTNLEDFRYNAPLDIPTGVIESERHNFNIETVIDELDPLPFSIEPLPDGRLLLTEKRRGLSIISTDGKQSALIRGAPKAYGDSFNFVGQPMGLGWMMEVALHPGYENNGWIYLHYGDRCSGCNHLSRQSGQDVSMNKLVRGRIRNGEWVDQEVLWQARREHYSVMPEIGAGGRIAFDNEGHVYFGVGIKGPLEHIGIQDLSTPYGKIMRLHDDGRVPDDNPFVGRPDAESAIWTYGHRNPQGLEFNPATSEIWSSEMGPRGGDEFNLLEPGLNYGWPLVSLGVNYNGKPVAWGRALGIDFDPSDLKPPVVDFTPAPALSSFVFYQGDMFPEWNGDIIVGTLRASDLLRIRLTKHQLAHQETLLEDMVRFRDIEVGPTGEIYLLLEHDSGGRIIKLISAFRQ